MAWCRLLVRKGWPGFGAIGEPGPLGDSWKLFHEPVALAEELVGLGYSGLKVWPFDQAAIQYGPARIPHSAIEEGVQPLRDIRDKVGMDLDLLVDGAPAWLVPGGALVLELDPRQVDRLAQRAVAVGLVDVEARPDLGGRDRALVARMPG